MAEKKIRAMILGATGVVGQQCIRLLHQKGVEVVAALGRRSHLGEDIGELAGIGTLGVTVENIRNLEEVLERTRPNIAIDATDPYFKNVYPYLKTCALHGCNAISLSIEVYYPEMSDKALAEDLDRACKEGGATVVALGIQDVNWSNLCEVIAGNCMRIDSIHGENWCTIDYWGEMAAEDSRTAISMGRFYQRLEEEPMPQNSYTFALYEIADSLGLHVIKETNHMTPTPADRDYYSEGADRTIKAGEVIMNEQSCKLETEEGITIDASIFYTWAIHGERAENSWEIKGDPDIKVVTEDMHGEVTTTYDVVSRVPDVINAAPGLITVKGLPKPTFKYHDLDHYVL